MKKLKILVADNSSLVINDYKNNYENVFKKYGYNIDLTYCEDKEELNQNTSKEFDISFIDYLFFRDELLNIKSDHICLVTNSEDINILKYAARNKYCFMYKPYSVKKIINLIDRFIKL